MLVFQLKSVSLQTEVFLLQREVQKRGRFPQIFFDVGGRIYEIDEYKSNPSRSSNFCNT